MVADNMLLLMDSAGTCHLTHGREFQYSSTTCTLLPCYAATSSIHLISQGCRMHWPPQSHCMPPYMLYRKSRGCCCCNGS